VSTEAEVSVALEEVFRQLGLPRPSFHGSIWPPLWAWRFFVLHRYQFR
jgi:hypothetical protein